MRMYELTDLSGADLLNLMYYTFNCPVVNLVVYFIMSQSFKAEIQKHLQFNLTYNQQ